MTAEFNKAKKEVAGLETELAGEQTSLNALRGKLTAAGVETKNLAGEERRLKTAAAEANATLGEQQAHLAAISKRQANMQAAGAQLGKARGRAAAVGMAGAASLGAGVGLLAGPLAAKSRSDDFEASVTDIRQKMDVPRSAAAGIRDQLLEIGRLTNQMPDEVQAGIDTLTGLGLDAQKALDLSTPIGRAATAYNASVDDLAKAGFAVIDNLKVPVDQADLALDAMTEAGKRGGVELKNMAAGFPQLTAQAQAFGQKGVGAVADLSAALQVVKKGAGTPEQAITNLANLQQKLLSPETIKKFAKAGVDLPAALKKAAADSRSPIEAIAELTQKALHGDMSNLGSLFEDQQAAAALRSIVQNMDEYRDIRAKALAAAGVVDKDFADRMQDNQQQTKALKVAADSLAVTIGATLAPILTPLILKATAAATAFGAWTKAHPKLAAALAKGVLILGALLTVIGAIMLVVAPVILFIGMLGAAATALGVSVGAVVGVIAAVIAAVVALGVAVFEVFKHWDGIKAFFVGVWHGVQQVFDFALKAIGFAILAMNPVLLFTTAFAALWPHLAALGDRFKTVGGQLIAGMVAGITSGLVGLKNAITGMAGQAVGWIKEKLGIHSPSRVFASLGRYTMAGLEQGIRQGQAGPMSAVRATAAAMSTGLALGAATALGGPSAASAAPSQRFTPPIGAAAAAAGGAGDHYEIHIHPPAGSDSVDIARQVRLELERIEREKAGRQRATLRDLSEEP